jgi:sigma-E factor negative regulatory protein RseC
VQEHRQVVEERGVVVRVAGSRAEVEFVRQAACGSCSAKTACGSGVLGELFGRKRHRVWIDNTVNAATGDHVVVGIREGEFVATSLMAYLLPLLTLFAGALAAESVLGGAGGTELPVVLGAMTGLALGLYALRRWMASAGEARNLKILRKEPNVVAAVSIP